MSLTLTDLRLRLRLSGRNAGTGYTNAQLDIALDRLLARFLRITCVRKVSDTVAFVATTNEADFSALSGFLPGRIERMRVDEDTNYTDVTGDLEQTGAAQVLNQINADTSTGTPTDIAFIDSTTATFFPTPSDNGTLTVVYSPLQTPWTIGTMGAYSSTAVYQIDDVVSSSGALYRSRVPENTGVAVSNTTNWENLGTGTLTAPASVTSSIPDGLIGEIIATGGPPILQAVDPENVSFTGAAFAAYLQFERECAGIGSISGKGTFPPSLRV